MVSAMLLAHLVGDYLLQTNAMARWKSESLKGVLVHGSIVLVVTVLFALPFDPAWWPWALAIGLIHIAVDGIKFRLGNKFNVLALFLLDQATHLSVIMIALIWSGKLAPPAVNSLLAGLAANPVLSFVMAYVFLTVPSWVLVEFVAFGCIKGGPPDFSQSSDKFISSLERGLMTTFVVLGQYLLVPLVAVPRVLVEGPQVLRSQRAQVYVAQWLISITLAVAIGLGLQQLR